MTLLHIKNIKSYYGNICALKGVSMEIEQGEIVCLIGSNGAGKTTTLKSITGLIHPSEGSITFNGEDITNVAPHLIVERGIALVPEGRQVFSNFQHLKTSKWGLILVRILML